jgi:hypothetical protein
MEEQLKQIHEVVDDCWEKLDQMWRRIGHDPAVMHKRKSVVQKHVKVNCLQTLRNRNDNVFVLTTKFNDVRCFLFRSC